MGRVGRTRLVVHGTLIGCQSRRRNRQKRHDSLLVQVGYHTLTILLSQRLRHTIVAAGVHVYHMYGIMCEHLSMTGVRVGRKIRFTALLLLLLLFLLLLLLLLALPVLLPCFLVGYLYTHARFLGFPGN